jgi:cell division protein FtsB
MIEWTSVVLGGMTLVGGCGWVVNHHKYKQEVKHLEAENRQMYMDLAKEYVEEFTKNIVKPLEGRVNELTNEVKELKNELEFVKKSACYCADCPNRISVL